MSRRPDWLTDEQYLQTRYRMLVNPPDTTRLTIDMYFQPEWTPRLTLEEAEDDFELPIEVRRITLIRHRFVDLCSRQTVTYWIPDWTSDFGDVDDEAHRWTLPSAAAETVAGWCQWVLRTAEEAEEQKDRLQRMLGMGARWFDHRQA